MREPSARFLSGFLPRFWRDDSGATALEYGLIISLIFLVIVSAVTAFGNKATDIFNTAFMAISGKMSGG
jgi:pilus assembly protein Flp/PilA